MVEVARQCGGEGAIQMGGGDLEDVKRGKPGPNGAPNDAVVGVQEAIVAVDVARVGDCEVCQRWREAREVVDGKEGGRDGVQVLVRNASRQGEVHRWNPLDPESLI